MINQSQVKSIKINQDQSRWINDKGIKINAWLGICLAKSYSRSRSEPLLNNQLVSESAPNPFRRAIAPMQ